MLHRISCQAHRLPAHFWVALTLSMLTLIALSVQPDLTAQAAPTGNVCGQITTNITWIAANNPYTVTCDVQVMSGVTLTIQSGVIVKFTTCTSLQVDGTLIANGVTFTSGNAPPARGDWGRIYFTPTSIDAAFNANGNYVSGSLIRDSLIEWGGGCVNVSGAIETNIASPLIDHNTVRNSSLYGIHAIARSTNKPIVISRNNLSINGGGIHVSTGTVISNTIANNYGTGILAIGSTVTGNSVNANSGGGVDASGSTVTSNTISSNSGSPGAGVNATSSMISDNIIAGNTTIYYYCGGIQAGGNSTVTRNTINNNTSGGMAVVCASMAGAPLVILLRAIPHRD